MNPSSQALLVPPVQPVGLACWQVREGQTAPVNPQVTVHLLEPAMQCSGEVGAHLTLWPTAGLTLGAGAVRPADGGRLGAAGEEPAAPVPPRRRHGVGDQDLLAGRGHRQAGQHHRHPHHHNTDILASCCASLYITSIGQVE